MVWKSEEIAMVMLVAVSKSRNLIANERFEHKPSEVETVKLQKCMPNSAQL